MPVLLAAGAVVPAGVPLPLQAANPRTMVRARNRANNFFISSDPSVFHSEGALPLLLPILNQTQPENSFDKVYYHLEKKSSSIFLPEAKSHIFNNGRHIFNNAPPEDTV